MATWPAQVYFKCIPCLLQAECALSNATHDGPMTLCLLNTTAILDQTLLLAFYQSPGGDLMFSGG